MKFEIWTMFSLAYLAITLSPGPNVLLVVKNSVLYGWSSAFITVLGNLSCQFVIICFVAFGVGELLQALPSWFIALKCVGGIYLIYIGVQSIKASRRTVENSPGVERVVRKTLSGLFIEAFLVSASNPKTLIFLSAFLPQFLDVDRSHVEQFSIMYLSICVIVAVVHLSYALSIAHFGRHFSMKGFEKKVQKLSGGVFIALGGGVLFNQRV